VFAIASPISGNLAGRLAASFALCYTLFQQSDPQTAATCLSYAQTIYAAADVRQINNDI
jgi:hypothetical protein